MSDAPALSLADGQRLLRLSDTDLWNRYVALGGSGEREQMVRHLDASTCPDETDHNVIAQALNDAFVETGHDHPVAYRHLYELP